jgi:hypothetical protein
MGSVFGSDLLTMAKLSAKWKPKIGMTWHE